MKRFLLILVLPVLAMVYLSSCSEDVDFGPSIYDTSTPYLSDVDKWIRENYIGLHNIDVIYKWQDIEAESDKNLTPPRADTVVPFLRVVKKAWLDTYITLCGKDVMNPIFPKQLLLLGSNSYNTDGTVTQGTAEGGKKIVLYNLDEFNPSDSDNVKKSIRVLHHEFCHILNQKKEYNIAFEQVTPSSYTATWTNNSDKVANAAGFVTPYAMAEPGEDFAEMVAAHGMTFIGPTPEMIRKMGDKVTAKKTAIESGLPVVPGSDGDVKTIEEALAWGDKIGYPVIVKAAAGGGGKGMKVAHSKEELADAFTLAKREAKSSFANDTVYIEKYLQTPRHIEVQILADNHGNVVHLGERDCSLQRRHQKVLEESPSPALNDEQRQKIGEIATSAMKKMGYSNVGTIEFLYENGQFYFLEMNTRLQVEHPVTEMVTGIDLVREQIRVASGAVLGYTQKDVHFSGYAIECRINAEDPETFIPSPGKIGSWHAPGGLSVRVDSGMYAGYTVPSCYDSMVAKLIVHGRSRNGALMRLKRALEEFVIEGISTTIPLHQKIITHPDFIDGQYNIHWLEKFLENNKKD